MSADQKLEDIYEDISKLLYDVCSFLNVEVRNGTLSPEAQTAAKKLIQRSQKQCVTLTTLSSQVDKNSRSYMAMEIKNDIIEEEPIADYVETDYVNQAVQEEEDSYVLPESPVSALPSTPISLNLMKCPYNDSTVRQINQFAIKCGPLHRKERWVIIDQKKLIYGILIEHWLIIYSGEKKDVKPTQCIDLSEYEAHEKKDPIFEISANGKKSFQFIARSSKDMDQWITAINYKKTSGLPTLETSSADANNSFENLDDNESQSSKIYEDLEDIKNKVNLKNKSTQRNKSDTLPSLPPRKLFQNEISKSNEDEDIVYEDPIPDEDMIYHELGDYQPEELDSRTKIEVNEDVEQETYDELATPIEKKNSFNKSGKLSIQQEEEDISYDDITVVQQERGIYNNYRTEENEDEEDLIYDELDDYQKTHQESQINDDIQEEEDAEYHDISDYIRTPISANISENDRSEINNQIVNNEEEEEDIYDELVQPVMQKLQEEPEEEATYDEVETPLQQVNKQIQEINESCDTNNKNNNRPKILGPKPVVKVGGVALRKKSLKQNHTKVDSGNGREESSNGKGIHNIIQQMERSLNFMAKK